MPELPEVESVRRQLAPVLTGRRIRGVTHQPQARFRDLDAAIGGQVTTLDRRGKYLLARLSGAGGAPGDLDLVMHLGMTGSFRVRGRDGWRPDAYVRATFDLGDAVLDFRDVRRFGRLAVVEAGEYGGIATLARLGPEPLSPDFTPEGLHRFLARSRTPVKATLLGQRAVAGVGNIYADEALWLARIHPGSRRIGRERAERLWAAVREVIAAAIEREGTTFRDYQMVNGQSGRNADFLQAYGRSGRPCARCATPLRRTVVAGRGTTYCPRCQRV